MNSCEESQKCLICQRANLQELEKLARVKAQLLVEIESEVFAYTVVDGKISPKFPKYWDITDNQSQVYLRFE